MAEFAIMRTAKIKSVASLRNLEKHCSREKIPANANLEKVELNRDVLPDPDRLTLPERFKKMTDGQKIRKNAVLGIEVMLTYSPEVRMGVLTQSEWINVNKSWLEQEFGKNNLVRLWLHMDETTPHLHAFVIPIDEKGKLNCRAFLGGSAKLSALQDSYAECMKKFSLERGIKGSKAHHRTVKEFYRAVEASNKVQLPEVRTSVQKTILGAKEVVESADEYKSRVEDAFRSKQFEVADLKMRLNKVEEEAAHAAALEKQVQYYKPKAQGFDALNAAVKAIPDADERRATRENINMMIKSELEKPKTKKRNHSKNFEQER